MCGFSLSSFFYQWKQQGFADSRGTLFFDIARIIKEKHPKILFLENVKNFEKHDSGNAFTTIKNIIESLGYRFFAQVLNAADYGIPQKRKRIYMVCFRKDLKISSFSFPKPITELCKKQKIVIEQLHEFLNSMKQWEQMQFINASVVSESITWNKYLMN